MGEHVTDNKIIVKKYLQNQEKICFPILDPSLLI